MPSAVDEDVGSETMSKQLSLVVLRDKRVVEFTMLGENPDCIKPILPKRKPQDATKNSKIWIIDTTKRQALVDYIDDIYEKLEAMLVRDEDGQVRDEDLHKTRESLCGWFGLMGLTSRWLADTGVVWGLYLSNQDIQAGEGLKA